MARKKNENKKTDLISKIKKYGKIYLYTPKFNLTKEDIIKNNKIITFEDMDLEKHCKEIFKKINQNKNIFIISHSRGHIIANTFCKLYNKNIIGYINIDGGEQYMLFEKNIDEWI